ncbi:hypothetical protein [Asaia bogorensis]|uniref:Uncharacterized protein n=1 Tax=Asaia bogorensis NBRC 16594 TaxID=1231624 RepID=A0AAN4R7B2_9PROT|nr:hypothetical protein [Asaia bogorensis]GBQ81466.1 hypothetical protein AA0311_2625 [Asaia bogorensis NBRC 16594]GEL54856.1 hypothetical protein ABO01nite_28630 [Asaia bogorensis NBRC 16594]
MFTLVDELSSAGAILLAFLLVVSGLSGLLAALYMAMMRSRARHGEGPGLPQILGIALVSATLLTFANFTNVLNASVGSDMVVSVGAPTQLRAGDVDLTNLPTKTLAALIQSFLAPLKAYFWVYGMLFLYMSLMKIKAKMSGHSRASAAGCFIQTAGSLFVMHSDFLIPYLLKKVGLG